MKTLLHVGCGQYTRMQTTRLFAQPDWQEIRLDINPDMKPDIVASVIDMSAVASASVDAVYLSHILEHVYAHEVTIALGEIRRVLSAEGFAIIRCPDLQTVGEFIARGKLNDTIYMSSMGPITPHDMMYGHGASLENGDVHMAHRSGFTGDTLWAALTGCGFSSAIINRVGVPLPLELWGLASKTLRSKETMLELLKQNLPV